MFIRSIEGTVVGSLDHILFYAYWISWSNLLPIIWTEIPQHTDMNVNFIFNRIISAMPQILISDMIRYEHIRNETLHFVFVSWWHTSPPITYFLFTIYAVIMAFHVICSLVILVTFLFTIIRKWHYFFLFYFPKSTFKMI